MENIAIYILIGFLAQMIDGSLGMAYGVSCRSFLKALTGIPPAAASAVIHIAEIPTSLVSGISHFRIGNVDRRVFIMLLFPGVIGGVIGAWTIVGVGEGLEKAIDIYLMIMGMVILMKAIRATRKKIKTGRLVLPLGFVGGFLDAIGGGGWGPIVTSTMVATGEDVKKTIGTVNAAEFVVTVAETTAFALMMTDISHFYPVIGGLVVGGVIAAPIAARICRLIPERALMAAVGVLIIVLNVYDLAA